MRGREREHRPHAKVCCLRPAPQMAGGGRGVVLGRCDPDTWHPDLDWLEDALSGPVPPKMVVITNPCNPTGGGSCQGCGTRCVT